MFRLCGGNVIVLGYGAGEFYNQSGGSVMGRVADLVWYILPRDALVAENGPSCFTGSNFELAGDSGQ